MSQATGLGLSGAIVDSDLDSLESFYFRRKAEARIVVCPLADESLLAILKARGYRLGEFENTLVRSLDSLPEPRVPSNVELMVDGGEDPDRFVKAVGPNFVDGVSLPPELREMMLAMMGAECCTSVMARIEGADAGGGSLLVSDGTAMLAGAGTLPKYRNRGVHTALFDYRLNLAKESGCDLAVMGAKPGSASQRNAERKGFRVAYTKCVMVLSPDENIAI